MLSFLIINSTQSMASPVRVLSKNTILLPQDTPPCTCFMEIRVRTIKAVFPLFFHGRIERHPTPWFPFKAATEGAWDPDVIYGANRFLVTWEERSGPEDINVPLPNYERTIPGVIHGRSYDSDGENPIPDNNTDIDVSDPGSNTYHAENPCNAFGAGKYFVVWEENPANQPLHRYDADIKGALVTPR